MEFSLGAGTVILMADVDIIANAATGGDTITSSNDVLLGNLFAYAAGAGAVAPPPGPGSTATPVPTMSAYALVLTTLGLLVVAGRRIRSKIK